MKMYDVVLESLGNLHTAGDDLNSESARSFIAAAITNDIQDHIKEMKRKESKLNCCEEQAKALRERREFFED